MTCPFTSKLDILQPCIKSCQLYIDGKCAIALSAVQLNNISTQLKNFNKNDK